MPDGARVQSLIRIGTISGDTGTRARDWVPAKLWGQVPLYFAAFVISGLLWGTGHDLPSVASVAGGRTDFRTGVAWLALVAGVLAVAVALLGYAADLIRGSLLGSRLMIARQRKRRDRLIEAYRARHPGQDLAATEIALNFPMSDARLRPTALGNAEAAVADRVALRYYGLNLDRAWQRLASLLLDNDQRSLARLLSRAEHRADVAVYSAASWLVATIWVLPFTWAMAILGMTGHVRYWTWISLAGSLAVVLLIYTNRYREAIDRTVARGKLIESVVDVYRLDLLDTLGLRRPKPGEEPQIFKALADRLDGRPVDKRFLRDDASQEDSVQALTASIRGSVEGVVGETLRRALTGPTLANFDGYLSVQLLGDGGTVPMNRDGKARLIRDNDYTLVITIGNQRQSAAVATAPIRVRGGEDRTVIPFAVSIDSNLPALRRSEKPLPVDQGTDRRLEVPLRVGGHGAESPWLWIRVTQHDRTIQNLNLELAGGESI